jgi:hypothetical protein
VNKGLGRGPTQVRRRRGLQVPELLRRGVAAENLVAVWVATEARYEVAGSLGLRNPELGPRLRWGGALVASSAAWSAAWLTLRSWRARSSE